LTTALTVQCRTRDGTAQAGSDYRTTLQTLTFAPGETTVACVIPLINDAAVEPVEHFTVALNDFGNPPASFPAEVVIEIIDDDTPETAGQWGPLQNWPTVPIHMHLLPTGDVLFWDQHNAAEGWDGTPYLWDPQSQTFRTVPLPAFDLFCSGHAFTADGKLLISGGHVANGVGEDKAILYDPFTNSWLPLPAMNDGRWYPSTVTLGNGDMLVVGGTATGVTDVNPLPQVWEQVTGQWRDLSGATHQAFTDWPGFYPFLYVAPNGLVFDAGPHQTARYLDPTGSGAWQDVARSSLAYRDYGTSVMYSDGQVMILGGNSNEPKAQPEANFPTASAEVIDLTATTPAWQTIAPLSVGRRNANATLLPDGSVLVTGGSALLGKDNPDGAVFYAEQWHPATGAWTLLASHTRYRGYHAAALLLPDGRVIVGGGGHPNPPGAGAEPNVEIYSPPYLFWGPRPVVIAAPSQVTYEHSFVVTTDDAAAITAVNWIRLGAVTHSFNQNQRLNHLAFTPTESGLVVTAPATADLAPPGHYLLFLINAAGVPSVGQMIQIVK
jgi:hypothetical protein